MQTAGLDMLGKAMVMQGKLW